MSLNRSGPRHGLCEIMLLAGYGLLTVLRAPAILRHGRFWAEEGTVYFFGAWHRSPAEWFFAPDLGYYSLFNKLVFGAAAHLVSLAAAPRLTVLAAFAVQLLPALIVLYWEIPPLASRRAKAVALSLLLFVLPNHEVWLNVLNSQFWLCLCTALILIARAGSGPRRIAALTLLFAAGLTGVVSLFLLPLYWAAAWRERTPWRREQAVVLSICALIQAVFVFAGGRRPGPFSPDILLAAAVCKSLLLPFNGVSAADRAIPWCRALASSPQWFWLLCVPPLAWGALGLAALRSRSTEALRLFMAGTLVLVLSFLGSLEGETRARLLVHTESLNAGRYYFAPHVLFGLCLAACFESRALPRLARGAAAVVLAWALMVGAYEFARARRPRCQVYFHGPRWSQQVALWLRDPQRPLDIWPSPWVVMLQRRPEPSS